MSESTRPKFTDQQAAAILTRDVSIALSAGAGCGKTFVLTQRFLSGLEPAAVSTNLRSMVAITFTDRAAREMRDRIRSACLARLHSCDGDSVDHWLSILRGLDSARISTIHSFCTGVLRSQAVDAGLDPRFTVLEPALADTLLRNTSKDTINELLESGDPDAAEFVFLFGLERTRELMRTLVSQRFQMAFDRFADVSPEDLAVQWRTRWEQEFVPRLIAEFRASPPVLKLVDMLREHESTHEVMQERRAALLEWFEPEFEWPDPLAALQTIAQVARVTGGGNAKNWTSAEIYESVKNQLTVVRDASRDLADKLPINEGDLKLATEYSVRAMRLVATTSQAYESAKRLQGLLDFDDLILRTRDILRDHAEVRRRVAAGIQLLMVDEFQDTDPVQAEIVRFLCGDALIHGRLFLVGDAKQSIYRFRRADPGVFNRLRNEIPEGGQLPLSVNFRSQPAVLDFVNHVFAAGMSTYYEALDPFDKTQHSPTPAIEFLFATSDAADSAKPKGDPSIPTEADEPSAAELRIREADWIARRCVELLVDPTPRVRDKNELGKTILRRTVPGDIVILFRALSNVHEYESALRRYGLDYYLVGGKAFFAQQEIFDLLNLCRYLDDPADVIGLVGVLRSPFFNLSDDAIQAVVFNGARSAGSGSSDRPTLHESLQQEPPEFLSEDQRLRIRFAQQTLAELRAGKDHLPLAKLLSLAVERTGYDAALLTENLGSRKVANLRKLIEIAQEFDRAELFTLKDFVERIQTSVWEETDEEFATTLPETGDVIRLMSIHQSKGLEFPIVFVADIDRQGPPKGRSAVLNPDFGALIKLPDRYGQSHENLGLKMFGLMEREADAAETIRLFYVACTRAADYLILSAGVDPTDDKHSPWYELVASRFDTSTGQPKMDPLLGASKFSTAGRHSIPEIHVHREPPRAVKLASSSGRDVPLRQLLDSFRTAEPDEIPRLAERLERDRDEFPPLSVSRLETIDSDLVGINHAPRDRTVDLADAPLDPDQATALGSLVHHTLERVRFVAPVEWTVPFQQAIDCSDDPLNDETRRQAREMLARLVSSPIMDELCRAKVVHREVEFAMRWPKPGKEGPATMIRGIIDLLFQDQDGGWHVWDYKTNDFPTKASDEQLLAPYEFQLGLYAHAVTEWFGEPPRELALIAIRPKTRRIVLPWSEERWLRLKSRIGASIDAYQASLLVPESY